MQEVKQWAKKVVMEAVAILSMHWKLKTVALPTVHTSTQADSYVSFPVPTW